MAAVRKVVFAASSRADYGIVRRWLGMLDSEPSIELTVAATGALLDERWGAQVSLVREDGFCVAEVPVPVDTSSNRAVLHTMAVGLDGFAAFFERDTPDLLIVLGDRYEMLSAATAAALERVPILHVHGGEATFGNYDEFIRHAITKMSLYHFTATEEYRRRVIQLGEDLSRVWCLGALGAENCLLDEGEPYAEWINALPLHGYLVTLFHPETLTGVDPVEQAKTLESALDAIGDVPAVVIGSNADTGAEAVRSSLRAWTEARSGAHYVENLRSEDYHALVRGAAALVGNSSSGLIEAPSLGTLTVNIGHRQDGRVRGSSVIDVPCEAGAISAAVAAALAHPGCDASRNPYWRPRCAESYFERTLEILDRIGVDAREPKRFYDLAPTGSEMRALG